MPRNLSLADGYTKSIPVTFAAKEVPVAETDEEEKITVVETAGGELDEKVE